MHSDELQAKQLQANKDMYQKLSGQETIKIADIQCVDAKYIDDRQGHSLLTMAILHNHSQVVDIARTLLQNGADSNHITKMGNTALHLAVFSHIDIFKLLIDHGADTTIKGRDGKDVRELVIGYEKSGKITKQQCEDFVRLIDEARVPRRLRASTAIIVLDTIVLYYANKGLGAEQLNFSSYAHSARLHPVAATAWILAAIAVVTSVITASLEASKGCECKPT